MGVLNDTSDPNDTSSSMGNNNPTALIDGPLDLRRLPGMVQQPFSSTATVVDCIEMWDYVGGTRFRGFVAEKDGEKALFVFFDQTVIGRDLKAGYVSLSLPTPLQRRQSKLTTTSPNSLMALLELCDVPYFSCARLVVCVDRHAGAAARDSIAKDLGWIGFGLTTLDDFVPDDDMHAEVTSQKWLFMEMET
jgi:hypothetical protein